MANLQEVPTEELLSFHDYPVVHQNSGASLEQAQINVTLNDEDFDNFQKRSVVTDDPLERDIEGSQNKMVSIWSLDYYQRFFDVDTKDVTDRIVASMTPKSNNSLRHQIAEKPDLYGPFWITTTLIFTIAISGNVSDYLQHAHLNDSEYHWRYDFKLVSYAATAIWIYILLVPLSLWGTLKWTSEKPTFDEEENLKSPGLLELICIYGYSLFIYIPVSILWSIQIGSLQWLLALTSAFLSGSVLLLTLMPLLRSSKYKMFLTLSIISCHLLLASGFMLYFFHTPETVIIENDSPDMHVNLSSNMNVNVSLNITKNASKAI